MEVLSDDEEEAGMFEYVYVVVVVVMEVEGFYDMVEGQRSGGSSKKSWLYKRKTEGRGRRRGRAEQRVLWWRRVLKKNVRTKNRGWGVERLTRSEPMMSQPSVGSRMLIGHWMSQHGLDLGKIIKSCRAMTSLYLMTICIIYMLYAPPIKGMVTPVGFYGCIL